MKFLFPSCVLRLLLSLCLFSSCKGKPKIDSDKAQAMIIQTLNLPFSETRGFLSGSFRDDNGTSTICNIGWPYPGEQKLVDEGFREVSAYSTPDGQLSFQDCIYTVSFTDKAKAYITSSFQSNKGLISMAKVSEVTFGELKTVRQVNETEYEVEFTIIRTRTPFGSAFNERVLTTSAYFSNSVGDNGLLPFKARILYYDQGWKMATDDVTKIQKEFLPESQRE